MRSLPSSDMKFSVPKTKPEGVSASPMRSVGALFRRYSLAMGVAVAFLTAVLLYTQYSLHEGLGELQNTFVPRWQAAHRLHGDAQNVSATAVQVTLAFTQGEWQSMRDMLNDQWLMFDANLKEMIEFTEKQESKQNLLTAAQALHRAGEQLVETVRHRTVAGEDLGPDRLREYRRHERDLARQMSEQSTRLAGYTSVLAADLDAAIEERRQELLFRLWLQTSLIAGSGLLIGGLIWYQFRMLDGRLLRRIERLKDYMGKREIDPNLLVRLAEGDEIDAMHNKLARLLTRLMTQNKELDRLATTDGLTGLYNRRRLLELLDQEVLRARRYGILSLIMLDVDHFKEVNDNLGHTSGDFVLRDVSREIGQFLRKTDFAGRYGGEEFIALLPETSLGDAATIAERLCKRIASLPIAIGDGKTISVTISIGVAMLEHNEDSRSLIKRADEALYRAKHGGRNRVEVAH